MGCDRGDGGGGGGPLRWERDSPGEDFEAARAGQLDELARWQSERIARALGEASPREGWGRWIVPDGWADVAAPDPRCAWCQAAGAGGQLCAGCRLARARWPDEPVSLSAHWDSLPPAARRLHLCIAHRIDPWTGAPVVVGFESAGLDDDGALVAGRVPVVTVVPRTSWDLRHDPA
jgi:hypothetical protein